MCVVGDAPKQYGQVITKCSKLWGVFLDTVMKVLRSHDPLDHMSILFNIRLDRYS